MTVYDFAPAFQTLNKGIDSLATALEERRKAQAPPATAAVAAATSTPRAAVPPVALSGTGAAAPGPTTPAWPPVTPRSLPTPVTPVGGLPQAAAPQTPTPQTVPPQVVSPRAAPRQETPRQETPRQETRRPAAAPQAALPGASADGAPPYAAAMRSIESSGNYSAIGPTHPRYGRALGAYQVMEANIGPWTQEVLGRRLTPEQFLASPEAQDAVFEAKFGQSLARYGNPYDAASIWFTGRPVARAGNARDALGTTTPVYLRRFGAALARARRSPVAATRPATPQAPPPRPGATDILGQLLAANPHMPPALRQNVEAYLQQLRDAEGQARDVERLQRQLPTYAAAQPAGLPMQLSAPYDDIPPDPAAGPLFSRYMPFAPDVRPDADELRGIAPAAPSPAKPGPPPPMPMAPPPEVHGATEAPPIPGAQRAPDGRFYILDPSRPGKYLMVQEP